MRESERERERERGKDRERGKERERVCERGGAEGEHTFSVRGTMRHWTRARERKRESERE